MALQRALHCAVAGIGFRHAVTFLAERFAQEAPQVAIIFDEEDLHAANVRWRSSVGQCEKDEKVLT